MPAKRSGLGRGLDALLPRPEQSVQQVALEQLSVSAFQPRKSLDPEGIAELAASIADKGVLQPLLVRPTSSGFEIVAGERRFRAAQQAGLSAVPVIVKSLGDRETLEIAIIENLQREDLSPLEEARAFKQLMDFGLSQDEVAKAVGKSRSAVANTLRLLKLGKAASDALSTGRISAGHARAIMAQPAADRDWALEQITARNLSVRQSEELTRPDLKVSGRPAGRASVERVLEEELARQVGTRVKLRGRDKGSIELFFYSEDELNRLLELLGYQP